MMHYEKFKNLKNSYFVEARCYFKAFWGAHWLIPRYQATCDVVWVGTKCLFLSEIGSRWLWYNEEGRVCVLFVSIFVCGVWLVLPEWLLHSCTICFG
jgi:hypothetical protein